jgi:hypothetical protein
LSPVSFKDIENSARLQVVDEANGTTKMFYFIERLVHRAQRRRAGASAGLPKPEGRAGGAADGQPDDAFF